jgi:hypothetical protein
MKFENTATLANHQKKFCTDGDYETLAKLDEELCQSCDFAASLG